MILRALLKVELAKYGSVTSTKIAGLCPASTCYLADIIRALGMLFNVLVFSTEVANSVPFCLCATVGGWNNSLKLNWER